MQPEPVLIVVKSLHDKGLPLSDIVEHSGLQRPAVLQALRQLGVGRKSVNPPQTLTGWQEAILLGSLLGDGNLSRRRSGAPPHYQLTHSENQAAYHFWTIEQLGDLFLSHSDKVYVNRQTGARSLHGTSRATAVLEPYHALFYGLGAKDITDEVLRRVADHDYRDAILAVWFGDDGYRSSGNGRSLGMTLGCLSEERYAAIRDWFAELGYDGTLHTHMGRTTYKYLLFRVSAAHRLREAISPYLIESMQYKLDIGEPRKIRRSREHAAVPPAEQEV